MKISFLSAAVVAVVIVASCAKEADYPAELSSQVSQAKANYSDYELFCMAGNVKSITNVPSGYDVELYGSSTVYGVDILNFDGDSLIEVKIFYNSTNSTSKIDVDGAKLDIQNDKTYTFSTLDNSSLSSSSTELFKVTLAVIAHHDIHPDTTKTFVDNGERDEYGSTGAKLFKKPFWRRWTVTNEFYPGVCIDYPHWEGFWGLIGGDGEPSDEYAC